ncbi:MAG: FCSD flavin-binding domain-containing protein [Thiotrichales bacterium]
MSTFKRREFLKAIGGAGALGGLSLAGCATAESVASTAKSAVGGGKNVVVVGGGFAGAAAAKYIKVFDPSVNVTLVEYNKTYPTCPGGNWYLAGLRDMDSLTQSYDALGSKYGVKVVHDWVTLVDAGAKTVKTSGGNTLKYDRLVLAPGIDFKFGGVEGYTENDEATVPHAWKGGTQYEILRRQLMDMKDGGVFVMVAPPNPYRCPPGPYERISMVAHYLKEHKPKSKIILLDEKAKFSKEGLFKAGWTKLYGLGTDKSMLEVVQGPNAKVTKVDVKTRTVLAGELGEEVKADVLNFIPAQKAGRLAEASGLTNEAGWCDVNQKTWESKVAPGIHIIGDAAVAGALPKSGYAANSEAKVCAAAVVALLNGKEPVAPSWVNTCYSLVSPTYGISVAGIYALDEKGAVAEVKGSGGVTPAAANNFETEAFYAGSWYTNIVEDTWS